MSEYDANAIQVLSPFEAVRKRPGMYVGDTNSFDGLRTLILELVGDAVAQFDAREATEVAVELSNGWVTVRDDGLGLPPEAIEALFTRFHARYRYLPDFTDVRLGGCHGMGFAVVNALSSRLEVELTYDGVRWAQVYERGEPVTQVRRLGPTSLQGMQVRFRPDPSIFASVEIDLEDVRARLQDLAWCKPHLRVYFQERRLHARGGPLGLAREMTKARGAEVEMWHVVDRRDGIARIDIAMAWAPDRGGPQLRSFANMYATPRGGEHVDGFWHGLVSYARDVGSAARTHSAVRELLGSGLAAVIHVEVAEARYDCFARDRLCTREVARSVRAAIVDSLQVLPRYSRVRSYVDARLGVRQ
ncbi:MAG: hypothetical protein HOV81_24465 [Kofleriaceae bacterium]|nr:hypothetical protein [Kofleriaceae bacterium]